MKKLGSLYVALAFFGVLATPVFADCVADRPGLLEAADALTESLEQFDTALHAVQAEEKVIGVTHHFEEGLLELIEEIRSGATCSLAIDEFQHFHEDIQLIYAELSARPELFYIDSVLNAWNQLLPSFIRFQDRLYYGDGCGGR